jgi:hypothetical protein
MLPVLLLALAQPTAGEKAATLRYIESLRDPATGVYTVTADGRPNLRAVNGACKATELLGSTVAGVDKLRAFVLRCYDPDTGGFAEEPGGKQTVPATAVGVITAVEVGVPKAEVRKAMDYLRDNAKTWEEVRIGAAAVEAWGPADCPFDLLPWFKVWERELLASNRLPTPGSTDNGSARTTGSLAAFELRLGRPKADYYRGKLPATQWAVGGWGVGEGKPCDLESTYRVMRALHLLGEQPKDPAKLRGFLRSCRNPDGGYAVTPGGPSSMSGVYYAAMIEGWLK